MKNPSTLHIDRDAYRSNLRFFMQRAPSSRLCAVVKANAYGHGLVPCARTALEAGAAYLGIVDNSEVQAIREAGIDTPVMRLRPADLDETWEAGPYNLEECVGDLAAARKLAAWGQQRGEPVRCHLKLDVGMGRSGLNVEAHPEDVERLFQLDGILWAGVMTHFPCADEPDVSITETQIRRFSELLERYRPLMPPEIIRHAANSAAALRFESTHLDMIRPGIATYGLAPGPDLPLPTGLRPVMAWTTYLAQIRLLDSGTTVGYGMTYTTPERKRIGTLPIGYANGYDRRLSNRGQVLVRGVRCPVVGRISMDLVNVDLTPVPDAEVGDDVALIGCQGGQEIATSEMAGWLGTITYEITTSLGRAERQNPAIYPVRNTDCGSGSVDS